MAVTELASCDYAVAGLRLVCGEGAMGSDGFVAAVRPSDGALAWVAFFDCSHPFSAISIVEDVRLQSLL